MDYIDPWSFSSLLSLRSFFEAVGLCDAENVFPEGACATFKLDKLKRAHCPKTCSIARGLKGGGKFLLHRTASHFPFFRP